MHLIGCHGCAGRDFHASILCQIAPCGLCPCQPSVFGRDQAPANVQRGRPEHIAAFRQRQLCCATADVDVENARFPVMACLGRTGPKGGQHCFHVIACGRRQEFPPFALTTPAIASEFLRRKASPVRMTTPVSMSPGRIAAAA